MNFPLFFLLKCGHWIFLNYIDGPVLFLMEDCAGLGSEEALYTEEKWSNKPRK